jgi:hypothetical protein
MEIIINENDFKRLIALVMARRFPGQLDLIRQRVRKIARESRQVRKRPNPLVWIGRQIKFALFDVNLSDPAIRRG